MSRNRYEELERAAVLDPDEDENEQQPPLRRSSAERLGRLSVPFVRVPVSWFDGSDPRPYPLIGERGRLFLLLLHLSRWGKRSVALTSAVAAQIGQSRKERSRHLKRLETEGWVNITRQGRKAIVVRPIALAG